MSIGKSENLLQNSNLLSRERYVNNSISLQIKIKFN
jgi:hypothetical protein